MLWFFGVQCYMQEQGEKGPLSGSIAPNCLGLCFGVGGPGDAWPPVLKE